MRYDVRFKIARLRMLFDALQPQCRLVVSDLAGNELVHQDLRVTKKEEVLRLELHPVTAEAIVRASGTMSAGRLIAQDGSVPVHLTVGSQWSGADVILTDTRICESRLPFKFRDLLFGRRVEFSRVVFEGPLTISMAN